MKYLSVRNMTRHVELGQKVRVATSFVERAIGLLATPSLGPGEGLWLCPCTSIHTFFMRYPIDALFLDAEGTVLSQRTFRPWKASLWVPRSRGVLEFAAGTLERTKTEVGDQIDMQAVN